MISTTLAIAIKTSIKAGEKILEIYNSTNFSIETKSDNSPLTSADKAAHQIISNALQKTSYPILSEEGKQIDYSTRKNWETFWLVDPLDGTKEFIKHNDEFTVNIALIHKQQPICGVVYIPVTGELYYANSNGSFKSQNQINFEKIIQTAIQLPFPDTHSDFVVLGSRTHMNEATRTYIDQLEKEDKTLKIESKGSSLKFCIIAEGNADCYPRMGPTMEWDTAAGHAIVLYAGKSVNAHPDNTPLKYNKENLLNPHFIVQAIQ
jgi:3'(2'), 5'-bisphosphate nucleotidase